MFYLSDRVQHRITGDLGIVVGYGYRVANNKYCTTIKVRITSSTTTHSAIVEDLFRNWLFCPQKDSEQTFQRHSHFLQAA